MPKLAVFPKGFFDHLIRREMRVLEWLDLAATLDVDGAELHPAFLDGLETANLRALRREATVRGLALPMLCHSPDFTRLEAAERRREIDLAAQMIEVTAELGGAYCRVLSGQNRPGLIEAEAIAWVIESLGQLVPKAASLGVTLCLENHYKDGLWTYPEFAQSHRRYLAILDAVDSPWLKAQFDPSNAIVAGEDQYALLARVLARVATVHASDRYLEGGSLADLRTLDRDPARGYADFVKHGVIGRGLNDYDRLFSTLAGAGFDGWISIEDGDGPTIEAGMANLRASATFLRGAIATHWRGEA